MTDLTITQNSTAETINLTVLNKLYETVHALGTGHAHINGNITTQAAYRDDVEYLTTRFNGGDEGRLDITVNNWYIKFASPEVQSVLATRIGDGVGVTETAASSTELTNVFRNNQTSATFLEFKYFTATLRKWGGVNPPEATFEQWSGLTAIDFAHASEQIPTRIPAYTFKDCTNLTTVSGANYVTEIGREAFYGCTNLSITGNVFPSLTTVGQEAFRDAGITGSWDLSNLTSAGTDAFKGSGITSVTISSNSINNYFNGYPHFIDNCLNLTEFISDYENWNYQVEFRGLENLQPQIVYQPRITNIKTSINEGSSYDKPGTKPVGWLYYPNVTTLRGINSNGNPTWKIDSNQSYRSCFGASRGYGGFNLFYLKEITTIDTCTFTLTNSPAVVINNATPPTILDRYGNQVIYFTGRDGNHSPENADKIEIYVPDASVNTYKQTWTNHSGRIHSIHELNGGVIYATKQDFISAGKPTQGLIAEYLGLSSAELSQFVSDNNLTYYTPVAA